MTAVTARRSQTTKSFFVLRAGNFFSDQNLKVILWVHILPKCVHLKIIYHSKSSLCDMMEKSSAENFFFSPKSQEFILIRNDRYNIKLNNTN